MRNRISLLCGLLLLAAALPRPVVGQAQNEEAVKKQLWKAAFVETMRDNPRVFDETYEKSLGHRSGWADRIKEVATESWPREVAANGSYLSLYEIYRDVVRDPRDDDDFLRQKIFSDHPEVLDRFADQAYATLRADRQALSKEDRRWRQQLDRTVTRHGVPPVDGTLAQMMDAAPGGAVARVLSTRLEETVRQGDTALRTEIVGRFGSVDSASAVVLGEVRAQQGRIDSLSAAIRDMTAGQAAQARRRAAQVTRDSLVYETRAGVGVASAVLGLIDPDAGRFVEVAGDASIDASVAVGSLLEHGFTFAATGNLLGAGMKIAGLFGGSGPDPAARRHAQLVRMLAQIAQQLGEVQQELRVVGVKVDSILQDVRALQAGQIQQTETLTRNLRETEARLVAAVASGRHDQMEQYKADHASRRARCEALFPVRAEAVKNTKHPLGAVLSDCLQDYLSYARLYGYTSAFTYRDFRWGAPDQSLAVLANLGDPAHYVGVLPSIVAELRSASGTPFPGVVGAVSDSMSHPEAVAGAIDALVELRLRQPLFRFDNEEEHLSRLRNQLESYRAWSRQALARSREPDGGGLAAFERAKADVRDIVLALETAFLEREERQGATSPLTAYCTMLLRSSSPEAVRRCAEDRPRLTDSLAGKTPLELARYAIHHGRFGSEDYGWGYTPTDGPHWLEPYGHDGNLGGYYWMKNRYCVHRQPMFTRRAGADQDTLLLVTPSERCAPFEFQDYRKKKVADAHQAHLAAQVAALKTDLETWVPQPDQRWLRDTAYAVRRTGALMEARRRAFALEVLRRLNDGELPGLRTALDRLDRVQFAWSAYERLALGSCYDGASNHEHLRAAGALRRSGDLTARLAAQDLRGFMTGIDPLAPAARGGLPLGRASEETLRQCVPGYVERGIGDVGRYLALRRAARR